MKQQFHRDNHYVPELYLKQWARNGKVPTYGLLVPHAKCPEWKGHSPRGIAYHQYLYTYVTRDGETDELERWLDAEFESPAVDAINRAISGQRMCPEDWKKLERFAWAMDVRTPVRLREFLARQRELMPRLMEDMFDDLPKELSAAALGVYHHTNENIDEKNPFPVKVIAERDGDKATMKVETIVGRRMWLWFIRHVLTKTINGLPACRWSVLRAPAGMTWPTSDNPFVRLSYEDSNHYSFNADLGCENVEMFLPLSPNHLLYSRVGKRPPPRNTVLSLQDAQGIRRILIDHADRYIFAVESGDIQWIRPRKVCLKSYEADRSAWQRWHREQSEAEAEFVR